LKKTAWLLCLIMCFSAFTSCSSSEGIGSLSSQITSSEAATQIGSTQDKAFSLAYFSQDSLNPYSATQSTNFYLFSLMYDSLVSINNDFSVKNSMAQSIELEGDICTVTLKENLKFSDESEVTVSDVLRSFNTAKNSTYFVQRLKNVKSCRVQDEKIIFNLKKADKHFVKNLTFPIIKDGSNKSRALGSGRYMFEVDGATDVLVLNPCNNIKKTNIKSIKLVDIDKYSALPNMIKIGGVNFVYGDFTTQFNVPAAKSSRVIKNNLVYLGINSNNIHLVNKDIRKALSLSLNRKNILSDAYAGAGMIAASPFNPKATDLNSSEFKISDYNTSAANELFAVCSLTEKDENGFFVTAEEESVSLRLLVNKDNSARLRAANSVKLNLEAAGIKIDLIEESSENYIQKIQSGDYDLFIGEVMLTADNDISTLLSQGSLNGCDDGSLTLASYNDYLAGNISLDDFMRSFDLNTPFIPLLYRYGTAVYSASLSGNDECTEYDVFANMENWKF